MSRRFITIWGLLLLSLSINCVSVDKTYPVGAVKVSFFSIMGGRLSKKPWASYLALISEEWFKQNKRKLNEPFEKLKLPPNYPAVKIAPNKEISKLIDLIQEHGFYSLTPSNPDRFAVEDMKRGGFRTRVLNVEIDGFAQYVALEDLPPEEVQIFRNTRDIFYQFFAAIESPLSQLEVDKNWREILRQLPSRKK